MITVKGLRKRYGNKTILDNIDFEVNHGEILGFLGPNGAGKTTTMRILTGFLAPTEGEVRINNTDILEEPLRIRRSIGYLPENNPLYTDSRVYEALQFVAESRNISNITQSIQHVVRVCSLGDVITKPIQELSKGYKQRVGLAAALLGDPDILILDEPTSGLDPNQAAEVRKLIQHIGAKKTIIFSTHVLQEVTAVCNRAIIIHKGRIVASGTPQELMKLGDSKQQIIVNIEGDEHVIQQRLAGLVHVAAVQVNKNNNEQQFAIDVDKDADIRKDVFELVKKNNWTLLEMRRVHANLEDVFQSLTR